MLNVVFCPVQIGLEDSLGKLSCILENDHFAIVVHQQMQCRCLQELCRGLAGETGKGNSQSHCGRRQCSAKPGIAHTWHHRDEGRGAKQARGKSGIPVDFCNPGARPEGEFGHIR